VGLFARYVILGGTLATGVLFFLLHVVTKMHFAEQVSVQSRCLEHKRRPLGSGDAHPPSPCPVSSPRRPPRVRLSAARRCWSTRAASGPRPRSVPPPRSTPPATTACWAARGRACARAAAPTGPAGLSPTCLAQSGPCALRTLISSKR
jgi:hypothetical protein